MFETGTAKTEITSFKSGVGMMGYGMYFNIVRGQKTPLFARAFVVSDPSTGKKVAIVVAELCFISHSIKLGVTKKLERLYPELGFHSANVLLTAQHTHSGPGGYSHYGFYNFTIPGFVAEVYNSIVEGITEAIVKADGARKPARLWLHKGIFEDNAPVAFNRSLKAYNANPEVEPLTHEQSHLAVDRTMDLLRFDDTEGQPFASLNWFGVHTTSLSNDNHDVNWDNKGYAAHFHEQVMPPGFLSAFAQGTAGDITPNFIWDAKKGWTRGIYSDDDASARFNGRLQADKAEEILNEAPVRGKELRGSIDYAEMLIDFSDIACHTDFTEGKSGCQTSPACIGVEMLMGTREGPGMPKVIAIAAKGLSRFMQGFEYMKAWFANPAEKEKIHRKYRTQSPKHILIETGERKILATSDVKNLIVPGWADPTIRTLKTHHRNGALDNKPWTPQVLPLQLILIGELALATLPAEITTVAGKRLRDTLLDTLKSQGITRVILCPYSNAYSGYITTAEEYAHQCYEGGHTVFGKWTLAAYQTVYRDFARQMKHQPGQRELLSPTGTTFTEEELKKRSFEKGFQLKWKKKNTPTAKGFSPD